MIINVVNVRVVSKEDTKERVFSVEFTIGRHFFRAETIRMKPLASCKSPVNPKGYRQHIRRELENRLSEALSKAGFQEIPPVFPTK